MWSTLTLLLLFGPAMVSATTCTLYELPVAGECTIEIDWRVHNDKQALATCLEYFPTTFVKGERSGANNEKTKCTVTAAYKCVDNEHILMYDKCYHFPKNGDVIKKNKISEYVKMDARRQRSMQCEGGKLAAVFSSTHAKFLGVKAHNLDIGKLGIGMTTDGYAIDEETDFTKSMLHKKMWKLIEGDYWEGETLMKATINPDKTLAYPDTAKYLFMRTSTDHVYNRIQGSFERATGDVEVTFACEFPAVFTDQQRWYCDKLGSKGLGLDAVYVDADKSKTARCLYVTAGKYTFNGKAADMANIKGCQERPSGLHSTGLDDGTAAYAKYAEIKYTGNLRLAGFKDGTKYQDGDGFYSQAKCQSPVTDDAKRKKLHQQWKFVKHNGYVQHSPSSSIPWEDAYPRNECSDFPGNEGSTTIGLRNGKLVDMPPEIRAHAVCSMIFFQQCEHAMAVEKKSLCGDKKTPKDGLPMLECASTSEYNPDTKGFYTCKCPEQHTKVASTHECQWPSDRAKFCAWLEFGSDSRRLFVAINERRNLVEGGTVPGVTQGIPEYTLPTWGENQGTWNDLLDKAVVRDGCRLTVLGAGLGSTGQFTLIGDIGYGTHHVPNAKDGSLAGATRGMGASAVDCKCPALNSGK